MSEYFLAEKKRFKENWERVTKILNTYRDRYRNKNDVIEEALDLLENHLSGLNKPSKSRK